jgi:hypothetical protein
LGSSQHPPEAAKVLLKPSKLHGFSFGSVATLFKGAEMLNNARVLMRTQGGIASGLENINTK